MSAYVENPVTSDASNNNKNCWMRLIEVRLRSKLGGSTEIVFGNNQGVGKKNNFNISISGSKYAATLKDNGVVAITNLEYDTILKIMVGEYYKIEIWVGYESTGTLERYFKGEISYIDQKIHSRHDTTTYFTYASEIVASYSQSRISYTFNSGINLWSALNYICKTNGMQSTLSEELKQKVLTNVTNAYGTNATIIDSLTEGSSYSLMTDSSLDGNVINVTTLTDKRYIKIDPNHILIGKGNPTVTSSGLSLCLLPTFNFRVGDILKLDNSLIDVSSGMTSAESVTSTFNTNYLDKNGEYMIIEIAYNFNNRSATYELNIKGRALDIVKNLGLS